MTDSIDISDLTRERERELPVSSTAMNHAGQDDEIAHYKSGYNRCRHDKICGGNNNDNLFQDLLFDDKAFKK